MLHILLLYSKKIDFRGMFNILLSSKLTIGLLGLDCWWRRGSAPAPPPLVIASPYILVWLVKRKSLT
jgi:hypothetical protein